MPPQIRTAVSRQALAFLSETLEPSEYAKTIAALPPADLRMVEDMPIWSWLPLEPHGRIQRALLDRLGQERYREFWAGVYLRLVASSLFSGITQAAIQMFGASPLSGCKLTPRAYGLIFRDSGQFAYVPDPAPRRGILELTGWPSSIEPTPFVEGFAGCFAAFATIFKLPSLPVEVEQTNLGFRFIVTWGENARTHRPFIS